MSNVTPSTIALLARAFDALNAERIHWALLREAQPTTAHGDVDLLTHPLDRDRMERALAAEGFARVKTWRHGHHRFFVAYDAIGDAWVKLDVVSHLAFRTGAEVPSAVVEAVLARAVKEGRTMRLAPDDEFWALYLHCLLDRGAIPDRHVARLQQLAAGREQSGPLRDLLMATSTGADVTASVADLSRAGDVAGLLGTAGSIDAALPRTRFARRIQRSLITLMAPVIQMAKRPGISVAVIGPDGAGKSTLIESLGTGFFLSTRSYYLGLYGADRVRATPDVVGAALIGQLVMAWGAYLAGTWDRRRGRLVIFDRYGYDALLPPRSGRRSWKRRIRALLVGRMSPRPDLVVLLDAPPSKLWARKQEHDPATLERQRNAYLSLADRLGATVPVEVVDASRDAASIHRHVSASLWRRFAERR